MTPKFDEVLNRLQYLISKADQVLATTHDDPEFAKSKDKHEIVDAFEFVQFRTASLHFIETTLGKENEYFKTLWQQCQSAAPHHVKIGKALLQELQEELKSRWVWSTRGIASAEVYLDFLEMAEDLLSEGYKDAAAVMIGGVLEEHLRRLCSKNGIAVTFVKDGKEIAKKADALNGELANASIYGKLDQKWVTTALDLRNKAAHGRYGEYVEEQVKVILLQATMDFLRRNPS